MTRCLILLLMGCAPAATEPEDFSLQEVENPGESLGTQEDPDALDIRSFALVEVVSSLMINPSPFNNDERATVTSSYKLVGWERDGLAVTWTETLCGIEATEIFGTQTSFPAALIETFPVITRHGSVTDTVTGADFDAGPLLTVMGARLDDERNDPVPSDPNHPGVFDQDQDGHPGVTVRVDQNLLGQADVYVAQREINTYRGVVVSSERIEGWVENRGEQRVLGASARWAEAETERRTDPDSDHSWFAFQQVGADTDCVDIVRDRHTLFD